MRHPAAFPNMRKPGEVRAAMHATYDQYIHGENRFPKIRVTDPEAVPRKSQAIARALFREWQVIDEDNHYFDDSLVIAINTLNAGDKPQSGTVIAKVGRNAVNFAFITMPGNYQAGGRVTRGTFDTGDMLELLDRTPLRMTDGRELRYTGGSLNPQPQPDAVVTRLSGNASAFYDSSNPLAQLMPLLQSDPQLLRLNQILGEQQP